MAVFEYNSIVMSEALVVAACFGSLLALRRQHSCIHFLFTYFSGSYLGFCYHYFYLEDILWVLGLGIPGLTALLGALKFGGLTSVYGFNILYIYGLCLHIHSLPHPYHLTNSYLLRQRLCRLQVILWEWQRSVLPA